ncbi:hypothetical protein BJY59DRAFT_99126 [Rhodotorula toruloides]
MSTPSNVERGVCASVIGSLACPHLARLRAAGASRRERLRVWLPRTLSSSFHATSLVCWLDTLEHSVRHPHAPSYTSQRSPMAPPHPPSSSSASKGPPPQRRNGVLSDASNTPRQSNTPASVGTPRQSASNALKRGRVEEVDGTVDRWGRKRVFGERDWVSKEQHELETKRAQFVAAIRRKTEEEAALQRAGQGRGDEAAKIRSERGRLKEELKGIEAQISRLDGGSETSASDEEESVRSLCLSHYERLVHERSAVLTQSSRRLEHRTLGGEVLKRRRCRSASRNCSQPQPAPRRRFQLQQ